VAGRVAVVVAGVASAGVVAGGLVIVEGVVVGWWGGA